MMNSQSVPLGSEREARPVMGTTDEQRVRTPVANAFAERWIGSSAIASRAV